MTAIVLQPEAYQQTLARSFIVGGLGLHSGDYSKQVRTIAYGP